MVVGDGGLVRLLATHTIVRSGHRPMCPSLDSGVVLGLELDSVLGSASARLAGFPWDRVTDSTPGTVATQGAMALWVLAVTTAAVLRRCMAAHDSLTSIWRCMMPTSAAARPSAVES